MDAADMNIGDRKETAIFGSVLIDEIYETEAEARAAGFYADAHLKTGAWPDTEWKVLYDGAHYAAVRCPLTGLEKRPVRRLTPPPAPLPPVREEPEEPQKLKKKLAERPGQVSLWDL